MITTPSAFNLPVAKLLALGSGAPQLEPTALPQGVLFRDDFNGPLLEGWQWINEDAARWTFTGNGWLEIIGDDASFFGADDYVLVNFLARELPEGPFVITTHLQADPDENFKQATIYILEDPQNYIALNTGYCALCSTGGPGFYMETFIDNNPFGNAMMVARDPAETDVYLRLVNNGESLIGYYATEPGQWQRLGAFGNFFDFRLVGLGASNSAPPEGVSQDIVAHFDYFEIAEP